MILYNTTYSVANEVAREWLHWMRTDHIPALLATGLPIGHKLLRLLTELDNGGTTFSVQLDFTAMEDYFTYQNLHADAMQQRIQNRFANQFVSFDTLLEDA
ncbi:DUF4286 family protein [Spirosoma taeanense]|uniref:DUF4286 family protein n=1 Tax=Spirosoma taeanense TaxID=2735870 RepID=A0A6M5Y683_9BACT|nr:DUF4286 family protein [Spirosoma taeanense]QJW88860.1 DUF4286 family protein [Spirosoma taeanense]